MTRPLLVGSVQPHSGKSSIILALSWALRQRGYTVGYYKPLGNSSCDSQGVCVDDDSRFLGASLELSIPAPLVLLDPDVLEQGLLHHAESAYRDRLQQQLTRIQTLQGQTTDWAFVECGGTPSDGFLLQLSLLQLARTLTADVLMVARYASLTNIEPLLALAERLPGVQVGVILNDVPLAQYEHVQETLAPVLQGMGITILGVLPSSPILRSISVGELAQKLSADVLCGREHLDLLIEQVNIGAMAVSAALRFFRRMTHKAVVTGGDRADIQMAALQTSTNCLILTGQLPPDPKILARAEEMEVPVLSVSFDTLRTVRLIEAAISEARFQEPIKVECMQDLLTKHVDLDQFCQFYGLALPPS